MARAQPKRLTRALTGAERTLLADIIEDCLAHSVSVRLYWPPSLMTDDGQRVCGWFSDVRRGLVIAAGNQTWIESLGHEYCHFLQMLDGMFDKKCDRAFCVLEAALTGDKSITQRRADNAARAVQAIELDAERRTVDLLSRYGIEFDREKYIRGASAYVLSYYTMAQERRATDLVVHTNPEILAAVPSAWLESYWPAPPEIHGLIKRHGYARGRGAA